MKIAYYAPLKSPHHPVPSGDRQMARLLKQALEQAGFSVELVSEFRSFSADPAGHAGLEQEAARERERIEHSWALSGPPDLWFCYHLYYKAPDLLGPALCQRHGIPYVSVEASYSRRRNGQGWAASQALVLEAVRQAALNICMTARDREGLLEIDPGLRLAMLPPFLDAADFLALAPRPMPGRLFTAAMMRPGDKLESYRKLAAALPLMRAEFSLVIGGDGPCRVEVEAMLHAAAPGLVAFRGALSRAEIAAELSQAAVYAWPGSGEAYGLAYLEAQAAGVPVVAFETAGVPEVVASGRTGLLTPAGDAKAYAAALDRLLTDETERRQLAVGARDFISDGRTLEAASVRLGQLVTQAMAPATTEEGAGHDR